MELYLKSQGKIGMVLPHSTLQSGQYLKWRSGYYETKRRRGSKDAKQAISADFSIKPPYDLEQLLPNGFFPMPACVVFAKMQGLRGDFKLHQKTAKPLGSSKVEVWSGPTGTSQIKRELSNLIHDDGTFHSNYHVFANRGADVFDRRLYFVIATPNDNKFALPDTSVTYPRTGTQDKKTYSVAELEGQVVANDNLFNVYLGESLAPYVALPPLTAVLPVSKSTMSIPLDDAGEIVHQELDANMRARWEKMERLWEANRGKADTKSLSQNLNWLNKLTSQLNYLQEPGKRPIRVAYTTSGRPTAALITDNFAILDTNLYQVTCRNVAEAYYLLAIINSIVLAKAVDPFMPKGQFGGARHVHKHIWKLPIPEYDVGCQLHAEISHLGRVASGLAEYQVETLTARHGAEWLNSDRVRNDLRNCWQRESRLASEIEAAVGRLLG